MEQLTQIFGGVVVPYHQLSWHAFWEQNQDPKTLESSFGEMWEAVHKEITIFITGRWTYLDKFCCRCSTKIYDVPLSYAHVVTWRVDKIRRSFIWKSNKEKISFHLVYQIFLLELRSQGGIGIKNLKTKVKLLRRNVCGDIFRSSKLCVVLSKPNIESWIVGFFKNTTPYGVSLWRTIRSNWPSLKNHSTVKGSQWQQATVLDRQVDGFCQLTRSITWFICPSPTLTQDSS